MSTLTLDWLRPEERLEHEFAQLLEEGGDPSVLVSRWQSRDREALELQRQLAVDLLDQARHLRANELEFDPSAPWKGRDIRAAFSLEHLRDKLYAGWIGRAAGCLLGKPVEMTPRQGIREILESVGEWPLRRYMTADGVPPEVVARYPWDATVLRTSMRETIECMPEDDDLNYSMLNLHVLETYGEDFTTVDVASEWLRMMPLLAVFTAERVAYFNLLQHRLPPETAEHHNPYREWIGAQIRADVWGWVSPGDPHRAAELAFRDSRLSHTGNGILGAVFVASMLASAFDSRSAAEVVDHGLAALPEGSRLAAAIRFAKELPRRTASWEEAVDLLYAEFDRYHWVHTINNAALVTAALLFGEGDFEKSICNVVMGGWDTDCNGATVGSIVGVLGGRSSIPPSWSDPLDNRVRTSLKGFDNSRLDELAERTLRQVPQRYLSGDN